MNNLISCSLMILGISTFSQLSFANNPTNGYCQTADASVCGWNASAPAETRWFVALAFDPKTGMFGAYNATDRVTALQHAYKICRNANVVDGKQKRCPSKIASDTGSSSNTTPLVIARGQHADGRYGFNLRYNGYGTKTFWPQDSKNRKVSPVQAALDDCQYKFNMQNCTIVIDN